MEKELPIPKCFDDPADAAARLKEMFVDIGQARARHGSSRWGPMAIPIRSTT